MRVLEAALNATWAMEERALETLLDIVARENVEVTPEALEAYRAKSLEKAERARVRDGVAVLDAIGPMVKRANLFTAISGATSYDVLRTDLQAALDDPKVKSIILNIDSPGGEVNGGNELAQAVFDARGKKPIIAYVGGTGASMGYWLASAADKVIVDPTAVLGSIGVQVAWRESAPKAGEKSYRFVSSQSPLKNADPGTEAGDTQIQATIDAMAQVFVGAVARNRGVATETVLNDFGKGGIFVGQAAVEAGLADDLGTFESVFAGLSAGNGGRKAGRKGATMSDEALSFTAEQRDAAVATALTAEKNRVAGLRKVATGFRASDADLNAAIEGTVTVEAFSLAQADKAAAAREAASAADAAKAADAKAEEAKRLEALQTDEEAAKAAAKSNGKETDPDSAEAVAARIAAA